MKSIIIEPGKLPRFTGKWTLADFYQLLQWLLNMPLVQETPEGGENG